MVSRPILFALAILVARPATAGFTERVSVGVGGAQNGGGAFAAEVSSDGALVAFETFGFPTNLPGGTNGTFIRDRRLSCR